MNTQELLFCASLSLLAAGVSVNVQATEGGGSSYAMGSENYGAGSMPKPGFYGLVYSSHYEADSRNGNNGEKLPVDFRVQSNSISPRFVWVTDQQILGGNFALHTVMPLVDLKVDLNGRSQRQQGLGDITFGPGLGYHLTDKLRSIVGLDFVAPTGEYDRNDLAKIGRNYWVVRPVLALSYIDPVGLNADAKIMYDFNTKNKATDYTSGQEFHVDYSMGWGLGNGWVVGVGGYVYQQTTDDRQYGERIENNKGHALAIGPSIKYASSKGWYLTAKWQQETDVRNRAEGDAYWLKLAIPF
ncbi:signal peptide protein [Pseudomonas fluorescens HK44]|uniref:Signal peptide protein n=1 Tax=Pseudomonas fluorescens HK44 TaxID=1042209 RepID=A0A010RUS1_PSEFL|nr:signal peptide protein [Pseudomonas fluorescens HK44]